MDRDGTCCSCPRCDFVGSRRATCCGTCFVSQAQHQVLSTGQSVPVEQLNPDDPAHAAFIMLFRDKHPEYGRSISLKQFLKHLLPLVENMSKQEQEDLLGIPWSKPKQHTGEDEAE